MASIRWKGGAAAVAQVTTFAFGGTWEAADLIRVVIGTKKYDFTAGSTTTATVVSTLVTAWNALSSTDYPEFAEITASANTTTLTLTGDTAGVPFTATLTPLESDASAADAQTIEGAGTATTGTAATAATGPNHWDNARNWSGGAVPVNSDSVYLDQSDDDILYGLDQSAVTVTLLTIPASFTGTIGLPEVNDSATAYPEYRSQYLAISATTLDVGDGPGQGSGRLKINVGTNACTLTVRLTASPLETDVEALQWKGTHASNVVNVFRGSVAIAGYNTDAATVATLRVGRVESVSSDAEVRCGVGTTLTTVNQDGGQLTINSAATTVSKTEGDLVIRGAGAYTTITNDQGRLDYLSTGTITTLNVGSGATVDFSKDMRGRTITNAVQIYAGATILDPFATVTWSGGIKLNRCGNAEVTIDWGQNKTVTIA